VRSWRCLLEQDAAAQSQLPLTLKCKSIQYTATAVCAQHTARQCASAQQPGVLPQTSHDAQMCEIVAVKACSQIGSSFSNASDDCRKWACQSAPDECDVDDDCGASAQEAIQKSVPYCNWWYRQVADGCSLSESPAPIWEQQYRAQCVISSASTDAPSKLPGLGWHRQNFLKFTEQFRHGVPLYDRDANPVDAAQGVYVYVYVCMCVYVNVCVRVCVCVCVCVCMYIY